MTQYAERERGWTSNQIFKKREGVLGKILTFRGQGAEKEQMTFQGATGGELRGGWASNFYIKNKLNSEIFNDKKINKQKWAFN